MTDDQAKTVDETLAPMIEKMARKGAKRTGGKRAPVVAVPVDVSPITTAEPEALVAIAPDAVPVPEAVMSLPVAETAPEPPSAAEPIPAESPASPALITPDVAEPATLVKEEVTMDTVDTTSAAAPIADGRAMINDLGVRAKQAMEKGSKMFEEMNAFGKGNVEAVVESGKIAVKGFESLGQEAAEFTRKSFEGATEAMKTLAATRSPTEFMKLQSDYARSMFDAVVAETSRSTEAMIKLANDVAQPISNRLALAADKVKMAA